ncbi:hypothetical protein ABT202_02735 [Streptomyces sp900105245]|uniref:hypothetical protein n=1 Tax=Streptomyces sp. 900105245 TaxID=3154379 RepID=UPI003318D0F9
MPRTVTPASADSPATALGPTALVLGALAAVGVWPTLTLGLLPEMLIAGGLAVTFGLTGLHYAQRGVGRTWTSAAGVVLGAVGLLYPFVVFFLPLPF